MPAIAGYGRLYGRKEWKTVRAFVLARAGYRCEATIGCPNVATHADHIVPAAELAATGRLAEFFDPANLQAACRACNCASGASYGNRQRRHHRRVTAEEAAIAWAARENAYWAEVERRAAAAPSRTPRIY